MTAEDMALNFLTGPVSALALAVAILWGLGKFVGKYAPQVVEKHLKQMDDQMAAQNKIIDRLDSMRDEMKMQHLEQTETMRKSIGNLHNRLNPIEANVSEIKTIIGYQNAQAQSQS